MEPRIFTDTKYVLFRAKVRDFIKQHVEPHALQWEQKKTFPDHLLQLLAKEKLLGLSLPSKYGGHDENLWHEVIFAEELAQSNCLGWALSVLAHTNMIAPLIVELGTTEQKETILKPALQGKYYLALGVTEEGSGSDLNSIQTTLNEQEGELVLNGGKIYITNGFIAKYIVTLAKMPAKESLWSLGFIIVDVDLTGVEREKLVTSGLKSGDTALLRFKNYAVQRNMLLGEAGKGFYYLLKGIQRERLIGAVALNALSLYVINRTIEFLKTRERFGESLSKKQVIRHSIADLSAKIEASRQLTYNAMAAYAENAPVDKEIVMVKIFSYETAKEVIEYCSHIHGASAFVEDHWLSHVYQDAQAFTLAAGSSEIMRDLLSGLLRM